MPVETVSFAMLGKHDQRYEVPEAIPVAPGLLVFRLPHDLSLNNPCRWNIGHHSGYVLAEALRREAAFNGAELLASRHDWTKDPAVLQAEIDDDELLRKLSTVDCLPINSEYMRGDVSRNGLYTDADVTAAATEFKAHALTPPQIRTAMYHSVPWMGLDTVDFDKVHDRIVRLTASTPRG